jgi:hypothetical protein
MNYIIMGQTMSQLYKENPVNYHCPTCKQTGKTPNLAGRFFIINDNECQCNGCKTIFPKSQMYKPVVTAAKLVENPRVKVNVGN